MTFEEIINYNIINYRVTDSWLIDINVLILLGLIITIFVGQSLVWTLHKLINRKTFFKWLEPNQRKSTERYTKYAIYSIIVLIILNFIGLDIKKFLEFKIVDDYGITLTPYLILGIISLILFSQLFVWGFHKLINQQKFFEWLEDNQRVLIEKYTKYTIYVITGLIILNLTGLQIKELFEFKIIDLYNIKLTPYHILGVIFLIYLSRLLLWTFEKVIMQQERSKKIDAGKGFAIYKISKYIIIIITISLVLETVGIKITILLAGSAALLVGLGLGIQQIFNDVISGIFLLFEGTVSVHDIVQIDDLVGEVTHIDIRTSKIKSRDNITIIVPNSKLISDNVINWTLNKQSTRFQVKVGVAYGSDTEKVRQILLDVANDNPDVTTSFEDPYVRFDEFGDSSLNFTLLFWSKKMFRADIVQSDIRFEIDKRFRKEGITIPFPQRDLHIKTNDTNIKL
ncbi:MAG: mechanosensitive ion channel [Cytophagales bacterium]|nr:mechanosensitive ion channel [Cytophagales bacterium]